MVRHTVGVPLHHWRYFVFLSGRKHLPTTPVFLFLLPLSVCFLSFFFPFVFLPFPNVAQATHPLDSMSGWSDTVRPFESEKLSLSVQRIELIRRQLDHRAVHRFVQNHLTPKPRRLPHIRGEIKHVHLLLLMSGRCGHYMSCE